jgi:predicted permease
MSWMHRLLGSLRKNKLEDQLDDELQFHVEMRTREFIEAGMPSDAARSRARQQFGNHLLLKERTRDMDTLGWIETLGQDIRYAARILRKNSAFTAVAVLALALGIGANTAIFSVVNGVLLRPLSFPEPDRLLLIFETTTAFGQTSAAYPNFVDWRRTSRSFTGMAAYRTDDFNFTGAGEPDQLAGAHVSANLFPMLGVTPLLGRNFLPEEDRHGAACTVMLTYGFWKQRFAADPNVLGKTLTLNGASCAVIGVLPRDLRFQEDARIFVPIEQWNSVELGMRESHPGLRVVGRLKQGVTIAAAQAEMASVSGALARQYPKTNTGAGVKLVPMKDDLVGNIRPTLLLLAGAVGLVLLIACANVANLLLARATARKRELAIRAALGAGRARVVRQLLTEGVVLSLGGAIAGLLLARWGTSLVLAAAPDILPRSGEIGIDPYVLLFTLAVSIVTGVLFGLAPAIRGAQANPQEFLKEGTRGAGGGRHRTEGIFVAAEVALALVLVMGAGLMIQSIWRLWKVDPGFNTRNVLTAQTALSPTVMASPPAMRLAFRQMLERVAAVPGVRSAAITNGLPLSERDNENSFWLGAGPQPAPDQMTTAMFYVVTPDYPSVMQIPLDRGRFFTDRDNAASPLVVVIDDVLAKSIFPGQDPIGRRISLAALGPVEIVGVVGHVKQWGLDSDDTASIRSQFYFPFMQIPDKFMSEVVSGFILALRTGPEPTSLLSAVRAQVAGPAHDQPIYTVRTVEQIVSASLGERRFTMLLLIIFAATALLLAAIGIYGVMSYAVTRRTHELGIRTSLGASRREIIALVMGHGMRLTAIGLAAGVVASLALTRFLAGLLYGVRPADPATLAAVTVLLGTIALVACYIPARRATHVDPMTALRHE